MGRIFREGSQTWLQHDSQKDLKSFEIIKCWIVRQFENEYNPIHHHSGYNKVGYLKVPENLGSISQKNKMIKVS